MVAGELLVEDGVFKRLDVEEVIRMAEREKEKLLERLEEVKGKR